MQNKKMIRSTRTGLMSALQHAFHAARLAQENKIPVDELAELRHAARISRRNFISVTGKAALLTGIAGSSFLASCTGGKRPPRIVIIGAGIAGLNAARILAKAGLQADIYEASNRTGGRMFSAHDILAPGLVTELGGEFIDTAHTEMFELAKECGLHILDTTPPGETALIRDCYYFNGRIYKEEEIISEFMPASDFIQKDINALSDVISYNNHSDDDVRLDTLSISEYLQGAPLSDTMRNILTIAYTSEYGLDASEQSAINFLYLFLPPGNNGFTMYGNSDERYKIAGGNQQICDCLAEQFSERIHTGYTLEAMSRGKGSDTLHMHFRTGNGNALDADADYAIITIPFTMLRLVDMQLDLTPQKKKSIAEMGYGKNAKLLLGFGERSWRKSGYGGYLFSDLGIQNGWDNSQGQAGTSGGYTVYTGGSQSKLLAEGSEQDQAILYMPKIDSCFPGTGAGFNGRASRFLWADYPYIKGSYACYQPGQWTSIEGAQSEPAGNLFFAGEHCSFEFQGFMNGGAETGKTAALQLLKSLGTQPAAATADTAAAGA